MAYYRCGGGEKGFTPSILVTGIPQEDTVYAEKDGKRYESKWVENGHLIENLPSFGTYTVTATNGIRTATQDVLVDIAAKYVVKMGHLQYLYKDGDECEDVTGGWTSSGYTTISTAYVVHSGTKNDDNMDINGQASNVMQVLGTDNPINLSGFSKLCMDVNVLSVRDDGLQCMISTTKTKFDEKPLTLLTNNTVERAVFEIDISDIDENAYIVFSQRYTSSRHFRVYRVWLE